MDKVKIALLGLGTVGCGVLKGLKQHRGKIEKTLGKELELCSILVRSPYKKRNVEVPSELLTTSIEEVFSDPGLSVVIEAMGGLEPALSYVKLALHQGCHVITANKALIAKYGQELHELAAAKGVQLLYEASVGGAIPIISTVRHFLKVNEVYKLYGILNGTTNYILTKMWEREESYQKILLEAQSLGYAEADPTADVEGYDALHKLTILTNLCFGITPDLERIARTGIADISVDELKLAYHFGYRIKLLASVEKKNGNIHLKVAPSLLPLSHPLASVDDVVNAVCIQTDLAGELTFFGRGAGELPTASAVLEDLFYLLRNQNQNSTPDASIEKVELDYAQSASEYFLYLQVPEKQADEQLSKLLHLLRKEGIYVHNATQVLDKNGFISIGARMTCHSTNTLKNISYHFGEKITIREVLEQGDDSVYAASVNL
ncbi:homoserine dehydrogenase [Fodinisporobacter ferrooxydans]|uniref:Homoserine dehydrogenase n=1 Tax=Fodinisporobacter ferrooxydans TaxID=2901836 RepID=A0ABY4CQH2_9BACL|nr:homoserine dehydrogenase [Alicyclobacillaceae bacterium MYW30-H2]